MFWFLLESNPSYHACQSAALTTRLPGREFFNSILIILKIVNWIFFWSIWCKMELNLIQCQARLRPLHLLRQPVQMSYGERQFPESIGTDSHRRPGARGILQERQIWRNLHRQRRSRGAAILLPLTSPFPCQNVMNSIWIWWRMKP